MDTIIHENLPQFFPVIIHNKYIGLKYEKYITPLEFEVSTFKEKNYFNILDNYTFLKSARNRLSFDSSIHITILHLQLAKVFEIENHINNQTYFILRR